MNETKGLPEPLLAANSGRTALLMPFQFGKHYLDERFFVYSEAGYIAVIDDSTLDPSLDGIAPKGYYRGTFQTQAYTRREWGKVFDFLEYRERGMMNWHDLVVMRAPAGR